MVSAPGFIAAQTQRPLNESQMSRFPRASRQAPWPRPAFASSDS